MRVKLAGLAITALTAFGQNSIVLPFAHTEGERNMQEIATAVRTIADIRDASVDTAQKTLTLAAPPDSIKLAEWLFSELDAPNPPSPANYRLPGDGENLTRIFWIRNAATVQQFQEIATAVRVVTEIRRVFTYGAPRAMIVRGTSDQMQLVEWLVNEIDQPAGAHAIAMDEYHMTAGFERDESAIRVFYLAHAATVQDFQEVATGIRTIADIRSVFAYSVSRAMIIRGTPDQMTLAGWLVNQLDTLNTGQARQASEIYSYPAPLRDEGTAIRVFFLNHAGNVEDFLKAASQVRTTAQIRRVFTYIAPRALVVRGSTDQLSVAALLVKDIE